MVSENKDADCGSLVHAIREGEEEGGGGGAIYEPYPEEEDGQTVNGGDTHANAIIGGVDIQHTATRIKRFVYRIWLGITSLG
eukprot:CAMPEP_0202468362 /NCGR_PEP_ID=MMETSP1360-20130828/75036_1 /ASSEMBLY_ACC=CAM_ASM_000848 /TAXON_ID=515479 /ORGANISM="Licmophora paradoxa, Strain CCMP2313" /LENGTH=81 /DNA_ID=CAMNT_0049093267 /DNA_START=258 /DNA_END=503 /DNA_ORIENTATION=+